MRVESEHFPVIFQRADMLPAGRRRLCRGKQIAVVADVLYAKRRQPKQAAIKPMIGEDPAKPR
jgi:hypothetical protein